MAVTRTAQDERGSHQHPFRRVRMPPNFFAIAFGLAGLAEAWQAAVPVLGGYAVLMVLAQPRLSLVYSRLSFSPGFWAFTFSYSAVVAGALTLLTGFIAWIGARTTLLAVRGRLFPAS